MPRILTAGLVLCLLAPAVGAQVLVEGSRQQDLRFRFLTTADGLSHDSVFSVIQDQQGFLWIGTGEGLNRYDGYDFRIFASKPFDATSLAESEVSELHLDSFGRIWIGTWGGGLDVLDPRTEIFEHYREIPGDPQSLLGSRVMAIHEDRAGILWVGTRSGLNRLDPATGTVQRFAPDGAPGSLSHSTVRAVAEDAAGRLWVGTNNGLDRFDPQTQRFEHKELDLHGVPEPHARQIGILHLDRRGSLWIGTHHGLHRMDGETLEVRTVLDAAELAYTFDPNAFLEDRHGHFWIGTMSSGLLYFDPADGTLARFAHGAGPRRGLSNNLIDALFEDRSGNLWIGTRGGGLNRLDLKPQKFRVVMPQPLSESSNHQVLAVQAAQDGQVWMGTHEGIVRFDPNSDAKRIYLHDPADPRSLWADNVHLLFEDSQGRMWVGVGGSLDRYEPDSDGFRHYRDQPGVRGGVVVAMHEDREGTLWIGNLRGGLGLYDPAQDRFVAVPWLDDSSPNFQDILSISEDGEGAVWVGTYGNGLLRLHREESSLRQFLYDPTDPASLSSNNVFVVHQDRQGVLWVGTSGGLDRYDSARQRFTRVPLVGDLPTRTIVGMEEDADGNFWLMTNSGLARFDPETGKLQSYGVEDGLLSRSFNQRCHHQDDDGTIYAGTNLGLVIFNPRRVEDNPFAPEVRLTRVHSAGQDLDLGQPPWTVSHLELARESPLGIEFAALEFTSPDYTRYAYRFAGLEEEWTDLGTRNDLTFPRLEAGRYNLEIRAANNDGLWSEQPLTLSLEIPPPFWNTAWFYTLSIAGLALLLSVAHKARTRQIQRRSAQLEEIVNRRTSELRSRSERLEEANQEIQRFVNLISHDLRGPLLNIQGFVSELRHVQEVCRTLLVPKPGLEPGERREAQHAIREDLPEAVDFIESAAQRMDRLTRAVLEVARLGSRHLEPEWVDLRELVEEILDGLRPQAERYRTEVEVRSLPPIFADRFSLERILENLLGNAFKYLDPGRPGRVVVEAERSARETCIRIIDNGRGIAEDDIPKIFEIFRRVGSQNTEGEGIGLACVRILVQHHGGRLECTSELGLGSTFSVYLPRSLQALESHDEMAS